MLSDLQKKYEVVLLSSPGPEWERIYKSHPDIKCIEVNMERHISPIKDIKSCGSYGVHSVGKNHRWYIP